ncbi:DUF4129 domain-containing protein [Niabella yanshanensis]|uniref:DUF4129 domain-containing protein n=1 Tax=Niabella yanshanensis TaxID=577386 RepID=A0ABZ0W349_9BACT|nr:DUF4129 domain-containing protein [Niabella yanshanensis]
MLLVLLLAGILIGSSGQAQTDAMDSLSFVEPPAADTILQTEEEYDDNDYEGQESYEDSIHRAETNAFDTLSRGAASVSGRKLPAGYIDNLKREDNFDYVKNGIPEPEKRNAPEMSFPIGEIWIYVAIILFLLLLAWYLKEHNLLFFRKKSAAVQSAPQEELLKDIFTIEYESAIKEALSNNNYRLAIRLHYLQLLKTLSEKGMIQYQPDKTNFDYLLQIRSTPHHADFSSLTRQYEYSWYGLFPINQAQYDHVEQLFANFHKKIGA